MKCLSSKIFSGAETGLRLRSHLSFAEVILRWNAEGIGDPVEKREHSGDVDGFGDLSFGPAGVADFLNLRVSGARGVIGDEFDVGHQGAFGGREPGFVELAFEDGFYGLVSGSLNTQEVGVAIQSIWAPVQKRNVTGDHLVVAEGEMAGGEINGIGKIDDLL